MKPLRYRIYDIPWLGVQKKTLPFEDKNYYYFNAIKSDYNIRQFIHQSVHDTYMNNTYLNYFKFKK